MMLIHCSLHTVSAHTVLAAQQLALSAVIMMRIALMMQVTGMTAATAIPLAQTGMRAIQMVAQHTLPMVSA
jgi:hypothetical protein